MAGQEESNPQPAVLETAALPIELLAYRKKHRYEDLVLLTPLDAARLDRCSALVGWPRFFQPHFFTAKTTKERYRSRVILLGVLAPQALHSA